PSARPRRRARSWWPRPARSAGYRWRAGRACRRAPPFAPRRCAARRPPPAWRSCRPACPAPASRARGCPSCGVPWRSSLGARKLEVRSRKVRRKSASFLISDFRFPTSRAGRVTSGLLQVLGHLRRAEYVVDSLGLVERLVGEEADLGRELQVD